MATESVSIFNLTSIIFTLCLVISLGYAIYCTLKKKRYGWKKPFFIALFILAVADFILLIIATLAYIWIDRFPVWISSELIKGALVAAVLITFDFAKRNYTDIKS